MAFQSLSETLKCLRLQKIIVKFRHMDESDRVDTYIQTMLIQSMTRPVTSERGATYVVQPLHSTVSRLSFVSCSSPWRPVSAHR
jgi:hypothetical protein